jgi:hypothetical protein
MAEHTEEELRERVWEDLSPFRLDQEGIDQVMLEAPGCVVTWVAKNGRAMGVYVTHAIIDGEVWVTTTGNRSKTRAWKRDPRVSAVFGVPGIGSVTLLGTIELSYDPDNRTRFLKSMYGKLMPELPAEALELHLKHMDTPGRLTGPIKVEKYITFDQRKLVT